ncbi:Stress-response A/B barrel domain-containing protein HS1 [Camellia lanceoleosa]|uniref:Stress-response A/B barrel domain-containing protein HS1 n=2 Tax=Camellia lanceoleosa TaxID=1840588 RepID=A0ACC0I0M9_9ERIC|nr:Stress-response A/B barrel domain-containing protein HS1 [Camellia lanceoleosa]KAI8019021.1 Stress-response A/B barrel domain-containing protein HS1 [Camellia lanceoleosa]
MEEEARPKGVVKHILLVKFKDGIPPDQIDQLIKDFAKLVHHIEPLKSFHWGKDISIENLQQGFTHVFELTFETIEGIAEYISHPTHVEFANVLRPVLEKLLVVDYKPEPVQL